MEAARFPYTENMVKKKDEKIISNPRSRILLLKNPVSNAIKKIKMLQ